MLKIVIILGLPGGIGLGNLYHVAGLTIGGALLTLGSPCAWGLFLPAFGFREGKCLMLAYIVATGP